MTLLEETRKYAPDIIAWRHDIHSHPEVGFDLPRTSKKLKIC